MDFYGRVENKKLVINNKALNEFIRSLDGKYVTLTVKQTVSKRSTRQNRLWWLYMQMMATEIGYTTEEMHEIAKMKLCKRTKVDERTGEQFEYLKSTTKYNKTEFAELVNQLQIWAADGLGVVLPNPSEQLEIPI
jgi:hypothetical protein